MVPCVCHDILIDPVCCYGEAGVWLAGMRGGGERPADQEAGRSEAIGRSRTLSATTICSGGRREWIVIIRMVIMVFLLFFKERVAHYFL